MKTSVRLVYDNILKIISISDEHAIARPWIFVALVLTSLVEVRFLVITLHLGL